MIITIRGDPIDITEIPLDQHIEWESLLNELKAEHIPGWYQDGSRKAVTCCYRRGHLRQCSSLDPLERPPFSALLRMQLAVHVSSFGPIKVGVIAGRKLIYKIGLRFKTDGLVLVSLHVGFRGDAAKMQYLGACDGSFSNWFLRIRRIKWMADSETENDACGGNIDERDESKTAGSFVEKTDRVVS